MGRYSGRRNSIMRAAEAAVALHAQLQEKLWSRGLNALLCPTVFTTDIGADMDLSTIRTVDIQGTPVDSYLGWVGTLPFNLLSRYPALATPTGIARNGVPTSIQVVGAPFDDATVFRIARELADSLDTGLYTRTLPTMDL
jgi:Asp-tRNA(Asn)/Glu-tRNA(Gln) amidotransferase A subunit family amidase